MRRLLGVALAMAVGGPALARGKQTLQISLGVARELSVSGEDVSLRISLSNTGVRAVRIPTPFDNRNWEPKYVVRGPGGKRTFSAREVALPHSVGNPPRSQAVLVDLGPGEKLEGEVPLHRMADLRAPGKYAVAVRLRWGKLEAASREVAFRVEPARIRGATLVQDPDGVRVLWLQAGESGLLMEQLFLKSAAEPVGLRTHLLRRVAAAPAAATWPFATPFSESMAEALHYWRGFREPGALVAVGAGELTVRMPVADGALVAQNAFLAPDGAVEVAVVDGQALSLVGAGGTSWTLELPQAVSAMAAAERLDRKGGRKIALLAAVQDGLELSLVDATARERRAAARAEATAPLAGSRLALHVAEDGSSRAATLVSRGGKAALLQARFDPGGAPIGGVTVEDVPGLDALPAAAAIAFRPSGEVTWAALLPSGAVVSSASRAARRVSGAVLVPMQLHAGERSLYVLVQPADGAPALESMQ